MRLSSHEHSELLGWAAILIETFEFSAAKLLEPAFSKFIRCHIVGESRSILTLCDRQPEQGKCVHDEGREMFSGHDQFS
jgi:hypothetical protein